MNKVHSVILEESMKPQVIVMRITATSGKRWRKRHD